MILSKVILISLIMVVRCLKFRVDIGKGDFIYILTPIATNIIIILIIFGYAFRGDERALEIMYPYSLFQYYCYYLICP